MDKDKTLQNTSSAGQEPANADDISINVEDTARTRSIGKDAGAGKGGGGGGVLSAFTPAFGAKPVNFFELLAAAISATKMEQQKVPDFIEYLRRSGIRMAWVRAVVALYEEPNKPDDPLAYIVKLMGLGIPEQIDVKRMQDQLARLRERLYALQTENVQLREAIEVEEEALKKKEELISLYDESKFFSDYNSDDDYSGAEEGTRYDVLK